VNVAKAEKIKRNELWWNKSCIYD